MSLKTVHPLWSSFSSNPFGINKARLLSGKYMSDLSYIHWSLANNDSFCVLSPGKKVPGTIEHLLVSCPVLMEKRQFLFSYWSQQSQDNNKLQQLLTRVLSSSEEEFIQFLVDPSVVPDVISGCQAATFNLNKIFSLTRTFCYRMHRRIIKTIW